MSSEYSAASWGEIVENPCLDVPNTTEETKPVRETWLGKLHYKRVHQEKNDFIVAIAPSSKSAVSGVGKTTLGIRLAREFNMADEDWSARKGATLSATSFVNEILNNEDEVPDRYAVLSDELQGTLSDDGADSRRSMADSVIRLSRALATLRFRQLSTILITQSTDWIDQRVRKLLDALVLIQRPGFAIVYDVYENDLSIRNKEYTEKKQTLNWEPLPGNDPDYRHLHRLKKNSAKRQQPDDDDEDDELPKEQQMKIAQSHRDAGKSLQWIADNVDAITYSRETIRKETVANDDS